MVITFPTVVEDQRPVNLSKDNFLRLSMPSASFSPPPLLDVIRSEPYSNKLFGENEDQGRAPVIDDISDSIYSCLNLMLDA